MKTCVISFSSRADGNCAAIADCVQETLGAEGLTRFDFSGLSVHGCGACHCECFRQREACPYFADDAFRLNEAAALADRAVFIVPNYCDFPCSNFSCSTSGASAASTGMPSWRTAILPCRRNSSLSAIRAGRIFWRRSGTMCCPERSPDVCFLRAAAYHRISLDGDLMTCEPARAAVRDFLRDW